MRPPKALWIVMITATLLAGTNAALAGYDPVTGRFQQQDPLGTGPRVVFTDSGPKFVGLTGPKPPSAQMNKPPHIVNPTVVRTGANTHQIYDPAYAVGASQYADGMNLYEYTMSNPISNADPLGLKTKKFKCCTPCQKNALEADAKEAQRMISSLKLKIQAAKTSPDKKKYPAWTGYKLGNALVILNSASKKISSANVKCQKKCKSAVAKAFPLGNTVHICPGYWSWNDKAQAATYVHEGTHLGRATTDATYFWQKNRAPHDVGPLGIIGWDIIASTYDTWILTGFCIPGHNCPKKVFYNPGRGGKECPSCL